MPSQRDQNDTSKTGSSGEMDPTMGPGARSARMISSVGRGSDGSPPRLPEPSLVAVQLPYVLSEVLASEAGRPQSPRTAQSWSPRAGAPWRSSFVPMAKVFTAALHREEDWYG